MTFTILSVCTGNVCRSPIAEHLLARALQANDVTVTSAGVGALVGHGVPEPALRLGNEYGLDVSRHAGRQVDAEMIRGTDLVLGMARDHRRYLVELAPGAMRRAFTLREFARLAEAAESRLPEAVSSSAAQSPEDGMRLAVVLAASLRGTIPPPSDASDFDVVDPYRQSDDVYRRSFDELIPASRQVADYLLAAARLVSSQ